MSPAIAIPARLVGTTLGILLLLGACEESRRAPPPPGTATFTSSAPGSSVSSGTSPTLLEGVESQTEAEVRAAESLAGDVTVAKPPADDTWVSTYPYGDADVQAEEHATVGHGAPAERFVQSDPPGPTSPFLRDYDLITPDASIRPPPGATATSEQYQQNLESCRAYALAQVEQDARNDYDSRGNIWDERDRGRTIIQLERSVANFDYQRRRDQLFQQCMRSRGYDRSQVQSQTK